MDENGFVFDDIEVFGEFWFFVVDFWGLGLVFEFWLFVILVWELVLYGDGELCEEVLEIDIFGGFIDFFIGVIGDFGFFWEFICIKGGRFFDGIVLNFGFLFDDKLWVCWIFVLLLDELDFLFFGVCDFFCVFFGFFFLNGGIIGLLFGEGFFLMLLYVCVNRVKGFFFVFS